VVYPSREGIDGIHYPLGVALGALGPVLAAMSEVRYVRMDEIDALIWLKNVEGLLLLRGHSKRKGGWGKVGKNRKNGIVGGLQALLFDEKTVVVEREKGV